MTVIRSTVSIAAKIVRICFFISDTPLKSTVITIFLTKILYPIETKYESVFPVLTPLVTSRHILEKITNTTYFN